ncbi:hypothetical protein EF903_05460 [Streptomyces sp. WAC05292]|uniref:hypothetical protein n=1 Tax=Streptomyces sp. WAC05292 TaxID=2487418 RepID=UPI000F738E5B|nr:hypothetical protein [Streptomyces sp. WAC05292]RSS95088.1 hypothetical protein EF903_05460 [Streptomyces sp. WAC05292]
MTTAAAIDTRALLRTLRAAVRAVEASPGPDTLTRLSTALLALPGERLGGFVEDRLHTVLANVERAEENQLFPRIDNMLHTVRDQASMQPSWTPKYAGEMTPKVIRLLAVCHEQQADMEEAEHRPWARAAAAGTRLLNILLRRTDQRPAVRQLVAAAETFADRLRWAVAFTGTVQSAALGEALARQLGLFVIGPRDHRPSEEWVRRIGHVAYRFTVIPPKTHPDYPHGRVDVRRTGSHEVEHSFGLTTRTGPAVLDRLPDSL